MSRLVFEAADIRRVVEHSIAAPEQRKMVTGYDKETGDLTYGEVAEAAIILVHDQGVYLMSNGTPRDIANGETSFVAYARGCHPDRDGDWYDTARNLVGGDDFSETLPWANDVKRMLDSGARKIVINMSANKIALAAVR